jgi:predicted XRE-type DNA-binding protein
MEYLAITAKVENADNYIGWFADNIAGFATAKTREGVNKKLPMLLASYFMDQASVPPVTKSLEEVNPEYLEGCEDVQTIFVQPARISPVSLEIERAIKAAGINQSELARRLNVSRTVVSKWVNPFYTAHQMDTLERIADKLGAHLEPPKFKKNPKHSSF